MKVRSARYRDFAGIRNVFSLAFEEEYQQRGIDIVHRIQRIQKMYPLVKALSYFSNPYQDLFNVHVCEEDGVIAGITQISARNCNKSRWHIDNIAVHPDFRGRGLAQYMLNHIFDMYNACGGLSYTLEVDIKNAPAISLYEKLGFRKYATLHYYKMSAKKLMTYQKQATLSLPEGFRRFKRGDQKGLYELYCSAIPQAVRMVEDKTMADFSPAWVGQCVDWLKKASKRSEHLHWVVEDHDRHTLVASLELHAQLRPLPHVIHMTLNPGYSHLADQLFNYALYELANLHNSSVLLGSFEFQEAKREAACKAGFKKLTSDYMMVRDSMKVLSLPSFNFEKLGEEGAFKPLLSTGRPPITMASDE